jgi:hypothetical protein
MTMKTALLALLIPSAALAFAPPSQQQRNVVTSVQATTAELERMMGVDIETGKKIVSGHIVLCMLDSLFSRR